MTDGPPPSAGPPPDASLVEADAWRRVARQRTAALDDLQQRPLVRAAVSLERRAEPLLRRLSSGRAELTALGRRGSLVAEALPRRTSLAGRDRRLRDAVAALPSPPEMARRVTVVVADGHGQAAGVSGIGPDVEVVRVRPEGQSVADAVDRAIAGARTELVCLLAPTSRPLDDGWIARLASALGGDAVAAVPQLVHPHRPAGSATPHDLLVREEGLEVVAVEGTPRVSARRAGSPVDVQREPVEVAAGSAACLLVDRAAYDEVGGLAPLASVDAAVVDLCVRLRRRGGRVVAVPSCVVEDGRPIGSREELRSPVVVDTPAWRELVEVRGPGLLRLSSPPSTALRVVCTVACTSHKVAPLWGDWHIAEALATGLRRHGHEVRVQIAPEADSPEGRCADVHVVVRGLAQVRRTTGQRHVLWIISHPESVETSECDEADLVLVASERFAEALRRRTTTPVEVLLQATDHHRFRPLPPDPAHHHPVTVVAKTREVMRPIVADALAAGLRPSIYGGGWNGFVDDELVVAEHVANDLLPVVYSSAGVVLNDHWETMRVWGFVSNRLYDVLACATPVVSDHLPEIAEQFGDAVATYRTPRELGRIVRAVLDDPAAARERAESGRRHVLAHHTFDRRADELLAALVRHGLVEPA